MRTYTRKMVVGGAVKEGDDSCCIPFCLLMSRFLRSEDRCTMMVFKSQDIELVVYKVSNEESVALNP